MTSTTTDRIPEQWTVAEAKARFSEVIARAVGTGPQTITRNGKAAAVLVSVEEWNRKVRRHGSLAEFLATSPMRDSGFEIQRSADVPVAPEL